MISQNGTEGANIEQKGGQVFDTRCTEGPCDLSIAQSSREPLQTPGEAYF